MYLLRLAAILVALVSWPIASGCEAGRSEETSGSASRGETSSPPPNVLLISVDTLRPDHLGFHGYDRDTSPFLDSLAKRGIVFENASAQASWTLPSHMTLMTSTYPHTHQVENQDRSLPEGIATLAERLQSAGYRTKGFVTWIYLSARYGFGRGFDSYEEILPPAHLQDHTTEHAARAEEVVSRVIESWSEPTRPDGKQAIGSQPFFLFLHLFDPHMSYDPPIEYAQKFDPDLVDSQFGRYDYLKSYIKGMRTSPKVLPTGVLETARTLYDGEIRYVDDQLERLFAHMEAEGVLENTLVILTSDHGEEFNEHGSIEGHQWTLFDEVLRIPLLILPPANSAIAHYRGERVKPLVATIDIAPTILDLLEIPRPTTFAGRSLRALLDDSSTWHEQSWAQIRRFNQKWSLRTATHKLIYTHDTKKNRFGVPIVAGYELYDLVADPAESENRFSETDSLSQDLAKRLRTWAKERGNAAETAAPNLTPEELERLKSVGYIGN